MMTRRMAILLAGLIPSFATPGHAQQTKLTVMVFRGGQNLPLFAAQEKDFWAKRGLNVKIMYAPSADELPRVLADGRVQIIHSTSDNAIKILDVDKLDVALVIGGDNAHNHIIAQQDIGKIEDLRGETILLDTATSGYAFVLYAILKRHGLNKGDYALKNVGATPKRLAALLADKSSKAAVLNPPFSIEAVKAGLKDMGSVVSMIGPYQGPAGYTLRPWAKANGDTLVKYLQGCIEGVRWALDPANKAAATEMLARRLELAPDIAAAVYDVVTDKQEGFAKDGRFDVEGFKNVLALRAEYEGVAPAAPEKYLDLSYYQQALKEM
ncbi:MAG: ABC transporter substrate-binding protein [Hyphomicrobiales bacterium]|nr:ABC transporter substrate-binding protein [Hyphomicrobiales bacterium]